MIREELVKFRIPHDPRGKISTGMKVENQYGTEYPKSLDYFNVSAFPEIERAYGKEPKELIILFPSDNFASFFDDGFALWGKNKVMKRKCDGAECVHMVSERVVLGNGAVMEFGQGEVSRCICPFRKEQEDINEGIYLPEQVDNPKKPGELMKNPALDSYGLRMLAYVVHPKALMPISGNPIMFRSGSLANGDFFKSELRRYSFYVGVPFRLWCTQVVMVDKKFTRWNIEPALSEADHLNYIMESWSGLRYKALMPGGMSSPQPPPKGRPKGEVNASAPLSTKTGFDEKGEFKNVENAEYTEKPPPPFHVERKEKPKADPSTSLRVNKTYDEIKKKLDYEGTTGTMDSLKAVWEGLRESIDAFEPDDKDEIKKLKEEAKGKILKRQDDGLPF